MNYIHDLKNNITKELTAITSIVEIPKGSNEKWEVNEDGRTATMVRKIKLNYPFYYGFIPKTLADDKDPTDIIILTNRELTNPLIKVDIIAVIPTIDNGEIDDKFIGIDNEIIVSKKWIKKEIKKAIKFIKNYKKPYHKDTEVFKISYDKKNIYSLLRTDVLRYRKPKDTSIEIEAR